MEGIRLAALFSYMPNKLNYCGPKDANVLFSDYLKNNAGKDKVKDLLTRFEALYPYLEIIAKKNSKDPFDYDVVEAYWLGNDLADLYKQDAVELVDMLAKRGLVDSIAQKLIKKIGKLGVGRIPLTHLFNVMFVGVGAVTGKVPTIIENMDKCRVSWGTVCEIHDSHLMIDYNRLKEQNNKYFIDKNVEKIKVSYDKNFFADLKEEDIVAVHWGLAIKKLNSKELDNLKTYTEKIIGLISKP